MVYEPPAFYAALQAGLPIFTVCKKCIVIITDMNICGFYFSPVISTPRGPFLTEPCINRQFNLVLCQSVQSRAFHETYILTVA